MKGDPLPHTDEVSRYCRPSSVHNGQPVASAFELRPGDEHLSVNWLQFFESIGATGRQQQVHQVREAFRAKGYQLRPNGRFAVMPVGQAARTVASALDKAIAFMHWPEDGDDSHAGIFGYGPDDLAVALELKNLVRPEDVFAAIPPR